MGKRRVYEALRINDSDATQMNGFANETNRRIYERQIRSQASALGYADTYSRVTDPASLDKIAAFSDKITTSIRETRNEMLANALNALPAGMSESEMVDALKPLYDSMRQYDTNTLYPYVASYSRQMATSDFMGNNNIQTQWQIMPPETDSNDVCQDDIDKGVVDDPSAFDAEEYPAHRNCFVAGTIVTGPSVHVAFSRPYKGPIVTIRTSRGYDLTGTPNHPILTSKGWIGMGDIAKGDDVFSCTKANRLPFVVVNRSGLASPYEYQVPSRIEDVGRAGAMALFKVPSSTADFHGDGIPNSYVDVVWSYSLFEHYREISNPFQYVEKLNLFGAGVACSRLFTESFSRLVDVGLSSSSNRIVSGFGKNRSTFSPEIPHSLDVSSRISQSLLWPVHADGLRFPYSPDSDVVLLQNSDDNVGICADALSDHLRRFPRDVALDEIVDVRQDEFLGHVYNSSTADGWYSANGIIVSNCPHNVVPVNINTDSLPSEDNLWRGQDTVDVSAEKMALVGAVVSSLKDWEEDKHPRDSHGRFGEGSGSSVSWPTSESELKSMTVDHFSSTRNASGFDKARTLDGKVITPDTPLIMYTATGDEEAVDRFKTEGANPDNKPTNLARIRAEAGEFAEFAPGRGISGGLYLACSPNEASGYGRNIFAVRVKAGDLQPSPEQMDLGSSRVPMTLGIALKANDVVTERVIPASDMKQISDTGNRMEPSEIVARLKDGIPSGEKEWEEDKHPRDSHGRFGEGEAAIPDTSNMPSSDDYEKMERDYEKSSAQEDDIAKVNKALDSIYHPDGNLSTFNNPDTEIAKASGLPLDTVAKFNQAWSGSSSTSREGVILQVAAADKFGTAVPESVSSLTGKISDSEKADATKFLDAVYTRTQQAFKEAGITSVPVFRYMRSSTDDMKQEANMRSTGDHEGTVTMRPLSSWTTDRSLLQSTGVLNHPDTILLASRVPVERIAGTYATGLGNGMEHEIVLAGGDLNVGWQGKDITKAIRHLKKILVDEIDPDWMRSKSGSAMRGQKEWDEDKHPRDSHGRFGEGGEGTLTPITGKQPEAASPNSKEALAQVSKYEQDSIKFLTDHQDMLPRTSWAEMVKERLAGDNKLSLMQNSESFGAIDCKMIAAASGGTISTLTAEMYLKSWASSSNSNNTLSNYVQQAVAEKFGIPLDSKLQDNLSRINFDLTGHDSSSQTKDDQRMLDKMKTEASNFVDAQYKVTQDYLSANGIKELNLTRGISFEGKVPSGYESIPQSVDYKANGSSRTFFGTPAARDEATTTQPWKQENVDLRPVSSWTVDPQVAYRSFAGAGNIFGDTGYVMSAKVPADRILSLGTTGVGTTWEYEATVIGGSNIPVAITKVPDGSS